MEHNELISRYHTLLYVVDESLQLWDVFRLLPQRIQDHVIVGRANHIRLPQLALQEADLSLLLRHLQTLHAQAHRVRTTSINFLNKRIRLGYL